MMVSTSRLSVVILALILTVSCASLSAENLVTVNPDFANGLTGWELYGKDQAKIRFEQGKGPDGSNCAVVPTGHASIAEGIELKPGRVYELSFMYRRSGPSANGGLSFFFNKLKGINANAGVFNLSFPESPGAVPAAKWIEFREAFKTPKMTARGKLILSANGLGEIWYARVSLVELKVAPKNRPLIPTTDLSYLPNIRTKSPLYEELLSDAPGNYTVVAWTHNLNMKNLPASMAAKFTEEQWKQEVSKALQEAGEVGMMYYWLPGHAEEAEEAYPKYGVKFEVNCESSAVRGDAIKRGAEILNPIASSTTSVDKVVSLVDPVYIESEVNTMKTCAERFKGKPYVFAYLGRDEPSVAIPEGPTSSWGPFGKKCAGEVLSQYGFGKYAMPAPADTEYLADEKNQPFRWIAYNRWMAEKYAESKKPVYEALKTIEPNAKYSPCDYWFMSGFIPFDFVQMARYSDIVECDPYASSGERALGRGLYNHGFGPKFLSDIMGKPIRSIVQAFDYAGYEMTPEDLLEWVSQSMRAGATHISYYQMDNPRYNDPDRWKMMIYISKVITGMKALKLPTDPEVAILYSSDTHRSGGISTKASELYTAYSLLGERAGSWFTFVDDESLERGDKSLSKYRALYIPLGTYQRESVVRKIEEFVKNGGTVICGDPTVFSWDINGSDLSAYRERIFGVRTFGPKSCDSMIVGTSPWTGSCAGMKLPVFRPVVRGGWSDDNGWSVKLAKPGVRVLAKFADGAPAVTSVKYGKGEAIYFAANPFVPECLVEGDGWNRLFRALQEHIGAKTDRPIWRFKLPAPKQ
jgi:hypothetical protein